MGFRRGGDTPQICSEARQNLMLVANAAKAHPCIEATTIHRRFWAVLDHSPMVSAATGTPAVLAPTLQEERHGETKTSRAGPIPRRVGSRQWAARPSALSHAGRGAGRC